MRFDYSRFPAEHSDDLAELQQPPHHEEANRTVRRERDYFHNRMLDYTGITGEIADSIPSSSSVVSVGGGFREVVPHRDAVARNVHTLLIDFDRTLHCESPVVTQIVCDLHTQCFQLLSGCSVEEFLAQMERRNPVEGLREISEELRSNPVAGFVFCRIFKYLRPGRTKQFLRTALRSLPVDGVLWIVDEGPDVRNQERSPDSELRFYEYDAVPNEVRAVPHARFDIQDRYIVPWTTMAEEDAFQDSIEHRREGVIPSELHKSFMDKPDRMHVTTDLRSIEGRSLSTAIRSKVEKGGRVYQLFRVERVMKISRTR